MTALIVTTAHWSGDPRLNRHAGYLEDAGISTRVAALESTSRIGRLTNVVRALRLIARERPDLVILPDPELFLLGSIGARLAGVTAVIDVHEDYGKAARGRSWVPAWLTPVVSLLARLNDWISRRVANITLVAAPELTGKGSRVVLNIPNPASLQPGILPGAKRQVVYIGDVTVPRGAREIAALAHRMPDIDFVVIGKCEPGLAQEMMAIAGPNARLRLTGRKPHTEAWAMAQGSIAGLSLLQAVPAYEAAVATKLWEYCAAAIPPVVTDLRGQRAFVSQIDESLAAADIDGLQAVISRLSVDHEWRTSIADKARSVAVAEWERLRPDQELVAAVSLSR